MSQPYVVELRRLIRHASPLLAALGAEASAARPGPDKWSPREVVGHLVDSAANNHQRFVRGQLQERLVFEGYAQDDWVRVQRYRDAPWPELVLLWRLYNLHLARVMEVAPEAQRLAPRLDHNLAEIGFGLEPGGTATLDGLMRNYVEHLRHHLRQLGVDPGDPPGDAAATL
jgi:hypothetical protein